MNPGQDSDARDNLATVAVRVTELETLLMHLQQTVQDLDEVIRGQGKRLEALERLLARQREELRHLNDALTEPRSPEDEKPPHY